MTSPVQDKDPLDDACGGKTDAAGTTQPSSAPPIASLKELPYQIAPAGQLSMYFSFCFGQPVASLTALGARADWTRVQFITGMTLAPYSILAQPQVALLSGYFCPVERSLARAGRRVDYLPREFRGFFATIAGELRPGWVATTTCPADADGNFNLGVTGDLTEWFIRHKRAGLDRARETAAGGVRRKNWWTPRVLVETNAHMPHVMGFPAFGNHEVRGTEVDLVVTEAEDRPLPEHTNPVPRKADREIAEHVNALVPDGATIQLGIGRLPDAIGETLEDKRDLGIHTEMLTSCVRRLVESGAVTGARKQLTHPRYRCFNDHVVFSFAGGTQALYHWLDYNPEARCVPLDLLNDPAIVRLHPRFVSINNILACDLRGQTTCTAFSDGRVATQLTGIGGQASFVRAAQESPGGKAVQVMNATRVVDSRRVSNIVCQFPAGTPIGTPEYFTDHVVTEFGVARLRGKTLRQRVRALIAIAHPDYRDALARGAREAGMLA